MSKSIPNETGILWYQLYVEYQKQNISKLFHQLFGHVYITRLNKKTIKGLMKGPPTNLPELE